MQKNGPPKFPGKKIVFRSQIAICSLILFSKNSEILLGQGDVQSEPNWYARLTVTFRLYCK